MRSYLKIIIAFLFFSNQLTGQTAKPDTTLISDYGSQADSVITQNDSIYQEVYQYASHPSDDLYQNTWSPVNITYTSANLNAKRDTLHIVLQSASDDPFVSPIKGKIISGFRTSRRPGHTGVDVKLNEGDTVRCAFDGQVRLAKRFSGYGLLVLVRHNNGLETIYAHLSKICIKPDQYVKAGEVIGLGGHSGRATTDHLHFETRILGEPVSPEKIIDFGEGRLLCDSFYSHGSRIGQQLADLKKVAPKTNYLAAVSDDETTIHYSIRRGDTLTSIARMFGTTIKELCAWNNISPHKILQIGTRLIIQR